MPFDLEGAKKAGYSDSDIADYLGAQSKFDVAGARKAGYQDAELIQHLSSNSPPKPTQGASGQDAPRMAGLKRATGELATGRPELDLQVAPLEPLVAPQEPSIMGALKDPEFWGEVGKNLLEGVAGAGRLVTKVGGVLAGAEPIMSPEFTQGLQNEYGAQVESARIGAVEFNADRQKSYAQKRMAQASLLPQIIKDSKEKRIPMRQNSLLAGFMDSVDMPANARDAFVDDFLADWGLYKDLPDDVRLQIYQEGKTRLQAANDALGNVGQDREVLQYVREGFKPEMAEWSPEKIAFDAMASAPAMLAAIGGSIAGGPVVGAAVLGATVLPGEYQEGKAAGLSDRDASTFAVLRGLAEMAPEVGVLEAISGSPAGKAMLRKVVGEFVKTKTGRVAGVAALEALSETITESINMATEAGYLDKKFTLPEALNRLAYAGTVGGVMGAAVGGPFAATQQTEAEPAQGGGQATVDDVMANEAGLTREMSGAGVDPVQPNPDVDPWVRDAQKKLTTDTGVSNAEPETAPAAAAPQAPAAPMAGEAAAAPTSQAQANTPTTIDRRALADAFTIDDEGTIDAAQATTAVRAQVESALAAGTTVTQGGGGYKSQKPVSSVDEIDMPAILAGKSRIKIGGQPAAPTPKAKPETAAAEKETVITEPTLAEKAKEAAKEPVTIKPDKQGFTVVVKGEPQATYPTIEQAKTEKDAAVEALQAETDKTLAQAQIDVGAHEAASSPLNSLSEPTPGQIEANNAKLGHVRLHGMDISVENPAGSTRRSKPGATKTWSRVLKNHYGYIRSTEASDGDHVDVFLGEQPDSQKAYIIDQVIDGKYDEAKIVLSAGSIDEAKKIYLDAYEDGWTGLGAITEMPIDQFKEWVKTPATKKPVKWRKSILKTPETAPVAEPTKRSIIKDSTPVKTPISTGEKPDEAAPASKPRMGETADDVWKAIKAANKGIVTEEAGSRIVYPTLRVVAGDDFRLSQDGKLEIIDRKSGGVGVKEATPAQADEFHRDLNRDGVEVVLLSPPGFVSGYKGQKVLRVLHSPSGNSFESKEPKRSIVKAENEPKPAEQPKPKAEPERQPAYDENTAAIERAKNKTKDEFASWVRGRYGKPKAAELTASGQLDKWYAEANPKSETPAVKLPQPETKTVETERQKSASEPPKEVAKAAESVKQAAKVEDFGSKLEGARKDYAAKLRDSQAYDVAKVPLAESWPEPDYQKLMEGGADPWAVGFMHAARDEIPTKPQKSWKLKSWVGQVTLLRDTAQKIASGELPLDKAKKLIDDMEALHPIRDRIELYQAVGHDKSLKGIRVAKGQYSVFFGKQLNPSKIIWSVESNGKVRAASNWPNILGYGDTRAEAIAAFKKTWDTTTPEQDAKKTIKFELYGRRADKTYFIGKKIGRNVVELKDGFTDIKVARAYLLEHHDELVSILDKKKELPSERREENSPRIGIDHRNGADVTPEQFQDAFGFRGVQFGTQMENARRQTDLNESYDALMDLAGVLNIPPKALSLNGELGLAFGARGHGGKLAPKAHYERDHIVINLTKRSGAGSLGHEWLHGVDNYFARRGGNKHGFISLIHKAPEGVRPELFDAFKGVVRAINSTALPKRSAKLDQTRSKPYWATNEEMIARSFESYLIAKLQDQGASNDYLANIVSPAYWNAATGLGLEKEDTYPYPLESEMPDIRAAFDKFFEVLETKEEDGKTVLYQRGTGAGIPEKQATAEINRILRGFKRRPNLIVRQRYDQLPADIRAAIEARGDKPGDMRAIYWNGNFYVVADDVPSIDDLPELVMHEVVGHFGLDAMLDLTDKHALLDGLIRDMPDAVDAMGVKEFGDKWDAKNLGMRRKAAEEVFAYNTQRHLKGEAIPPQAKSWVEKLLAKIKAWVKSVLGLDKIKKLPARYDERFMRRLADALLKSLREASPISGTGQTVAAERRDGVRGAPAFTQKAPVFYSQLMRSAQLAKLATGAGQQWLATLKNMPGVKAEEIEATDLEQFLGDRIKIPKQEVVDYLQSNGVQVTETVLQSGMSDKAKARLVFLDNTPWEDLSTPEQEEFDRLSKEVLESIHAEPKFGQYTTPGGSNYRELLLTLPETPVKIPSHGNIEKLANGKFRVDAPGLQAQLFDTRAEAEAETQRLGVIFNKDKTLKADAKNFRSSHFDQPNIIAHIRFDERVDADGKRVMHIGELQSDWHQRGRKSGYRDPSKAAALRKQADAIKASRPGVTTEEGRAAYAEMLRLNLKADQIESPHTVPNAPFKTTWPELAMKRAMRWASENGIERITWDTGVVQADRYDLSKHYESVQHRRGLDGRYDLKATTVDDGVVINVSNGTPEGKLEDYVGKDVAQKIVDSDASTGEWGRVDGIDLKIGGEGMIGFYDRILPATVNKLIKKWGGKVADTKVKTAYGVLHTADAHGFDITPQMRESALAGLPMFARKPPGGPPKSPPPNQPTAPPSATFGIGQSDRKDNLLYEWQDKHIDTKRVVQKIEEISGQQLEDKKDPYLAEELYHQRTAYRVKTFLNDELKPLLEHSKKLGVSIADLEQYLWARHAEERNNTIAQRNPQMPDGGSGMMTADAKAYLAGLKPDQLAKLQILADEVDKITEGTRKTLVGYGLESQLTMSMRKAAWPNYVPLHRADYETESSYGIGQGFSVKGSDTRSALGSGQRVVNILAEIAMQRERAITRGEKNRVSLALFGLAHSNPNPALWSVTRIPKKRTLGKNNQVVSYTPTNWKSQPNVVVVRFPNKKGRIVERAVVFNEKNPRALRMAEALKNLDTPQLEGVISAASMVSRYVSSVNTQYNPMFGLFNFERDLQESMLNLSTTAIKGQQKKVAKYAVQAIRGIYQDARAVRGGKHPNSQWAKWFEEMESEGGTTGYRDLFKTSKERAEALLDELKSMNESYIGKKTPKAVLNWLDDFNLTLENATRVAAYRTARESGLTKQRAASIAKNLTVNFNRKGRKSQQANALYAFFNARVQGMARSLETWSGPAGKAIVAGGLLLGVAQAVALAVAGFDDDDPPEFVKQQNLIIPIGDGKYVMWHLPQSMRFLISMGRIPTEAALRESKRAGEAAADMLAVLLDSFNPAGSSTIAQTAAPTIIDPAVALFENKEWSGSSIYQEKVDPMDPTPGFARSKDTATAISKITARGLNYLSGGTEYVEGALSPTPDQIDYLLAQVTGGIGREYNKAEQTISAMMTGEDLPTYKIPLLGRLYGTTTGRSNERSRFYDLAREGRRHEAELEGRASEGRIDRFAAQERIDEYLAKHPEAEGSMNAIKAARQVSEIRSEKRKAAAQGATQAKLNTYDDEVAAIITRTLQRDKELREELSSANP